MPDPGRLTQAAAWPADGGVPSPREGRYVAGEQPHDVADGEHGWNRPAGGVDPERDVGVGVLVGEGEELGREQGAVVVVEDAVEHEHAPLAEGEPELFGEDGDLCFLSHDSRVRDDRPDAG
jgi:hypothetical protein